MLRIPAGAKISFLQMRVNDEVWLPKTVHVRADAKVALMKTFRIVLDESTAFQLNAPTPSCASWDVIILKHLK